GYADGLLEEGRDRIAAHIAECEACRHVLAELARDTASAPTGRPKDRVPAEILRDYLARHAPQREAAACRLMVIVFGVGLVANIALGFLGPGTGVLWLPAYGVGGFCYELVAH